MVRGRQPRPPRGSPQALPHPNSRGTCAGTRMCVIYSPTALDAVFWALARRGWCRPTPPTPAVDHLGGTAPGHRWRACRFSLDSPCGAEHTNSYFKSRFRKHVGCTRTTIIRVIFLNNNMHAPRPRQLLHLLCVVGCAAKDCTRQDVITRFELIVDRRLSPCGLDLAQLLTHAARVHLSSHGLRAQT